MWRAPFLILLPGTFWVFVSTSLTCNFETAFASLLGVSLKLFLFPDIAQEGAFGQCTQAVSILCYFCPPRPLSNHCQRKLAPKAWITVKPWIENTPWNFMAPAKGQPSAFSSPPPPFFFIAIPQSIKPLLSAPPLPAKICVHFKIQHFEFQSCPWEFPSSFTLIRPLVILF